MANETKEIILEIQVQDSIDGLAKLRSSMDLLIQKRQELAKTVVTGNDEEAKAIEDTNSKLRNMNMEYKAQQRVLDGYNKSQKEEFNFLDLKKNSIDQNTAKLKQLTAQYKSMKEPSDAATKTVNDLARALNNQKLAIGDSTSNIGKYFDSYTNGIPVIGAAVSGIKNMGLAFESAGGGVKGFGVALLATGLPLFITSLNFLIDAFKSFKPVADEVEKVISAIGGGFDALINGGSIIETAKQAFDLKGQLQDLEDAQNGVNIANSIYDSQIKQLMVSLRNKHLTEKDGLKIISDLRNAEKERFELNSQQAKDELRIARETFLNKSKLYPAELDAILQRGKVKKKLSDDEIESSMKANDLTRQQVLDLEVQSQKEQLSLVKTAENRVRIDDAELKRIAELTQKVNSIKGDSAVLQEQIENREVAFSDRIASEKKQKADAAKVELKRLADDKDKIHKQELLQWKETQTILDELVAQSISDEQAMYEKQIADIKAGNAAISLLEKNAEMQLDLQVKTNSTRIQIDEDFANSSYSTFSEYYAAKKKLYEDDAKFKEAAEVSKQNSEKATLQAAGSIANSIIGLVSTVANAQGEGAEFAKAMAFVQIAISEAIAIANAIQGATSFGASTGPGAIGAIPAAIVALVSTTIANIAQAISLLSTPVPKAKFAGGVIGLEGEGTSTSDSIDAKLSRGESVITAKATNRFHRELAMMEMSVGNSPNYRFGTGKFAAGFISSPNVVTSDGGFSARDIARNSDNSALIQQAIKNGFALAPAPKLSIVEFETKQSNRNRSVNISEA